MMTNAIALIVFISLTIIRRNVSKPRASSLDTCTLSLNSIGFKAYCS